MRIICIPSPRVHLMHQSLFKHGKELAVSIVRTSAFPLRGGIADLPRVTPARYVSFGNDTK
jgi:hypothetical protein